MQYGGALSFTVLTVLCRALLDPWLGDYLPLQMLYGAVILSIWIGGYRPALLAMVLGYLACDFLFITLRGQFGFVAEHDLIGLVVYLVSCGILISFGEVIHTVHRRLELQRRQLEMETTRRRKAEEEQRQSVEALKGFIQSSPLGIALLDDQMRYWLVNEALAKMNGLPAAEHVGKTVAEVVPEVAAAVEVMFQQVLQTGQAILAHEHEEETAPASGVRRWWELSWFPLRDPQQQPTGVGIINQEITERKRAEKALERERELL